MDVLVLHAAVEALAGAREVLAFGIGPSESVAAYLALRLRRIGRRARVSGATGLRLHDHHSTNGTFINKVRVREGFLKPGCTVAVGQSLLKFNAREEEVRIVPSRSDRCGALIGANAKMREIYSIMRANFDWVIVDTPPGFTAEVITSIDSSTDIVMVGMLDSLSLKNTKLGLETIVEGVELEAQRVALTELGFRHAQGFLFAEPMPLPAALAAWAEPRARAS